MSPRAEPRGLRTGVGRIVEGVQVAFYACRPERSRGAGSYTVPIDTRGIGSGVASPECSGSVVRPL